MPTQKKQSKKRHSNYFAFFCLITISLSLSLIFASQFENGGSLETLSDAGDQFGQTVAIVLHLITKIGKALFNGASYLSELGFEVIKVFLEFKSTGFFILTFISIILWLCREAIINFIITSMLYALACCIIVFIGFAVCGTMLAMFPTMYYPSLVINIASWIYMANQKKSKKSLGGSFGDIDIIES